MIKVYITILFSSFFLQFPSLYHSGFWFFFFYVLNRKTKNQRKTKWRRKKQRKKKKKEDEKKPQESKDDKESKEESTPPDIVLKVFMHCEGCACKVRHSLKGFPSYNQFSLFSRAVFSPSGLAYHQLDWLQHGMSMQENIYIFYA